MVRVKKGTKKDSISASLSALTAATLVLPGMLPTAAQAAEGNTVDFQYSHYQEGKRDISGIIFIPDSSRLKTTVNSFNPIEVDSVHGSAKVSLTDRIKFAFNYTQDTWGGATPISTAPVGFNMNPLKFGVDGTTIVGASPYIQGDGNTYLDKNFHPVAPVSSCPD